MERRGSSEYHLGGSDEKGLDNALENIEKKLKLAEEQHENLLAQYETAKTEVTKEFANEDELNEKTKRLDELNILLNIERRRMKSWMRKRIQPLKLHGRRGK